jgi:hypothetical protein
MSTATKPSKSTAKPTAWPPTCSGRDGSAPGRGTGAGRARRPAIRADPGRGHQEGPDHLRGRARRRVGPDGHRQRVGGPTAAVASRNLRLASAYASRPSLQSRAFACMTAVVRMGWENPTPSAPRPVSASTPSMPGGSVRHGARDAPAVRSPGAFETHPFVVMTVIGCPTRHSDSWIFF